MPDPLKVSMMSFGSQDGRSHRRVRRFGGDLFGSKWGMKIDESAEDTVVLLSQFNGIGLGLLIRSEFWLSALKAPILMAFNLQYVMVCGTV